MGRPLGQSDFLEEHEVAKILSKARRNTREGVRAHAILLTLASTPMRKGELCSLKVGSLARNGTPAIEYTALKKRKDKEKTRRVHIPIPESVYDTLQRYIVLEYRGETVTSEAPLFRTLGKHGPWAKQAITPASVDFLVAKYARLAGIQKRVTPHSFRATYLTLRLDRGVSLATLKELACHEGITSTQAYLRSNLTRLQEGALAVQFS